jgi:hypothetical protein
MFLNKMRGLSLKLISAKILPKIVPLEGYMVNRGKEVAAVTFGIVTSLNREPGTVRD